MAIIGFFCLFFGKSQITKELIPTFSTIVTRMKRLKKPKNRLKSLYTLKKVRDYRQEPLGMMQFDHKTRKRHDAHEELLKDSESLMCYHTRLRLFEDVTYYREGHKYLFENEEKLENQEEPTTRVLQTMLGKEYRVEYIFSIVDLMHKHSILPHQLKSLVSDVFQVFLRPELHYLLPRICSENTLRVAEVTKNSVFEDNIERHVLVENNPMTISFDGVKLHNRGGIKVFPVRCSLFCKKLDRLLSFNTRFCKQVDEHNETGLSDAKMVLTVIRERSFHNVAFLAQDTAGTMEKCHEEFVKFPEGRLTFKLQDILHHLHNVFGLVAKHAHGNSPSKRNGGWTYWAMNLISHALHHNADELNFFLQFYSKNDIEPITIVETSQTRFLATSEACHGLFFNNKMEKNSKTNRYVSKEFFDTRKFLQIANVASKQKKDANSKQLAKNMTNPAYWCSLFAITTVGYEFLRPLLIFFMKFPSRSIELHEKLNDELFLKVDVYLYVLGSKVNELTKEDFLAILKWKHEQFTWKFKVSKAQKPLCSSPYATKGNIKKCYAHRVNGELYCINHINFRHYTCENDDFYDVFREFLPPKMENDLKNDSFAFMTSIEAKTKLEKPDLEDKYAFFMTPFRKLLNSKEMEALIDNQNENESENDSSFCEKVFLVDFYLALLWTEIKSLERLCNAYQPAVFMISMLNDELMVSSAKLFVKIGKVKLWEIFAKNLHAESVSHLKNIYNEALLNEQHPYVGPLKIFEFWDIVEEIAKGAKTLNEVKQWNEAKEFLNFLNKLSCCPVTTLSVEKNNKNAKNLKAQSVGSEQNITQRLNGIVNEMKGVWPTPTAIFEQREWTKEDIESYRRPENKEVFDLLIRSIIFFLSRGV